MVLVHDRLYSGDFQDNRRTGRLDPSNDKASSVCIVRLNLCRRLNHLTFLPVDEGKRNLDFTFTGIRWGPHGADEVIASAAMIHHNSNLQRRLADLLVRELQIGDRMRAGRHPEMRERHERSLAEAARA